MSKLSLVDELSGPPLSSSSRSRDKSGDVSRSQWNSSLSLASVMSKLTSMNIESIPPLSSSKRSRDKSRDVSRGHWISSLSLTPLSYGHMVDITVGEVGTGKTLAESNMVDIAEGVVVTGQFSGCCDRSLRSTSRSEAVLVDLVVGREESVITIWVGGTEGLQVVRQLGRHQTGRSQDQ